MGFSSFSSNGLARAFSVTETRLLPVGFLFLTCPKIALHSNNYKKCTSYD